MTARKALSSALRSRLAVMRDRRGGGRGRPGARSKHKAQDNHTQDRHACNDGNHTGHYAFALSETWIGASMTIVPLFWGCRRRPIRQPDRSIPVTDNRMIMRLRRTCHGNVHETVSLPGACSSGHSSTAQGRIGPGKRPRLACPNGDTAPARPVKTAWPERDRPPRGRRALRRRWRSGLPPSAAPAWRGCRSFPRR